MKNVIIIFALFSALTIQAQVRPVPANHAGSRGFRPQEVTPAPSTPAPSAPKAVPAPVAATGFTLPSFALQNARYYWVFNGDRTGKFETMYLASDGRTVKVQTPYSQQVFTSYSATQNDDGDEGTSVTVRCNNGSATLVMEFDDADGAILYIRFLEGADGKTTFSEWYPAIYDFIEELKK